MDQEILFSELGEKPSHHNKVVITVVGLDHIGIIAGITSVLAQYQVNIEDITQKILGEYFTMILIGDISRCTTDLKTLKEALTKKGEAIGVKVFMQHAEVFHAMHRI
ncbi:ACT domain-containing protein [Thermatribacter velox]|uniref:UPF0237 protein QBE54_00010 n=1 Tax=Thermatribacter velox TaxID=3039681 RepID=A0ABZ2YEM8_9BACT